MMSVEFIYDHDCPNVNRTRENLLRAFVQTGVPAKWIEWERSAPETPDYARQSGSPAILVNGKDVAGFQPNAAATCRIYRNASGVASGVPSIDLISEALKRGAHESHAVNSNAIKQHLPPQPMVHAHASGSDRKPLDLGLGSRV